MAILGRGRKKAETAEETSRILDVTASMQGSLVFQEAVALRISGRFEGTLETRGDLTIGERASVQADITGERITVAGKVTGKIVAKQTLRLIPPAVVKGDLWTPVLEITPGARIEGAIHMGELPGSSPTEEPAGRSPRMTPEEVAAYLEVEVRVVEQWAREGKIPVTREGNQWRFEKQKIDEWVAAQKSS